MIGRRKKAPAAPTASRYRLRSSWTLTCVGATSAGPGMRPATSSMKVMARETRARLRSSYGAEWQMTGANRSSQQAGQKWGKRKQDRRQPPPLRMKCKKVRDRLTSSREIQRVSMWNVCTLRGRGKPEFLTNEMKRYKLSIVAVTETHLTSEMPLDEEGRYIILFSGRQDGCNVEGAGLPC